MHGEYVRWKMVTLIVEQTGSFLALPVRLVGERLEEDNVEGNSHICNSFVVSISTRECSYKKDICFL